MYKLSNKSKDRLETCHIDIQHVMDEVIKRYDFTVLYGHRSQEEQMFLYKKGRKFEAGKWVIADKSKVVTNFDGYTKLSKHNYTPSLAIDIAPYPLDWNNLDRFKELKEVVFKVAEELGVKIVWGADWDSDGDIKEHKLQDYPHFELA